MKLLYYLKISRPGLWFPPMMLYFVPVSTSYQQLFTSSDFWIGLIYCTFPLNFFIYGWNDITDYENDKLNPRKDNLIFGAVVPPSENRNLIVAMILVQLPFWTYFLYKIGWQFWIWLGLSVFANWVYNSRIIYLKGRPPWEVLSSTAYLLCALLSIWLNNLDFLPWQTIVYLTVCGCQAHFVGEIMDIEPDRQAGRKTTAAVLGFYHSKILFLAYLFIQMILLLLIFKDKILISVTATLMVIVAADMLFFTKGKPYTVFQMTVFFGLCGVLVLISTVWFCYSGCLLRF